MHARCDFAFVRVHGTAACKEHCCMQGALLHARSTGACKEHVGLGVHRRRRREEFACMRAPRLLQPPTQGPKGCAQNTWRFEPDGYLRAVLTAQVYDVAVSRWPGKLSGMRSGL
eukprot:351285-Chlamydomonas_euryale.AAC.6